MEIFFSGLVSLPESIMKRFRTLRPKNWGFTSKNVGFQAWAAHQQKDRSPLPQSPSPRETGAESWRDEEGMGMITPLPSSRTAGGQTLQTFGKVSTRDLPLLAIKPMAKNHGKTTGILRNWGLGSPPKMEKYKFHPFSPCGLVGRVEFMLTHTHVFEVARPARPDV